MASRVERSLLERSVQLSSGSSSRDGDALTNELDISGIIGGRRVKGLLQSLSAPEDERVDGRSAAAPHTRPASYPPFSFGSTSPNVEWQVHDLQLKYTTPPVEWSVLIQAAAQAVALE